MRILFLAVLLVLVSCNAPKNVPTSHDCSEIYLDSMFIRGEHICFVEEQLCSHEEDEWVMIVEQ